LFDSNLTVIHFVSSITKEAIYFLDAITVVGNASDQESNLYQTLGVGVGAGVLLANVDQAKTVYSFVQVKLQFAPASNSIFILSDKNFISLTLKYLLPSNASFRTFFTFSKFNEGCSSVSINIPSKDIATIHVGDRIRFSTQGSKQKPITLEARISSIASSATRTEQGNFFKIEGVLRLKDQEAKLLRYGLEGKCVLITGEKSYFSFFVDQFLGAGN